MFDIRNEVLAYPWLITSLCTFIMQGACNNCFSVLHAATEEHALNKRNCQDQLYKCSQFVICMYIFNNVGFLTVFKYLLLCGCMHCHYLLKLASYLEYCRCGLVYNWEAACLHETQQNLNNKSIISFLTVHWTTDLGNGGEHSQSRQGVVACLYFYFHFPAASPCNWITARL